MLALELVKSETGASLSGIEAVTGNQHWAAFKKNEINQLLVAQQKKKKPQTF